MIGCLNREMHLRFQNKKKICKLSCTATRTMQNDLGRHTKSNDTYMNSPHTCY